VVMDSDREQFGAVVIANVAYRGVEADVLAYIGLFDTAFYVVPEHFARRIGGDLTSEMLLEGVVGKFQAFLGAVGPEVTVHAAVDRLAVFVQAGAPGVVPHAAPVGLLLEADQFRDVGALGFG